MSGPVFVLGAHRAGGTLLARILNCHPELVIWGEHGGLINRLAEIDAIAGLHPPLIEPLAERGLPAFVVRDKADPAMFNPWATPISRDGFRDWCRHYLEATFRHGLGAGQRWGFKEIRYHTPATAQFLAALFPDARFVILLRVLHPLALSNLFAPWTMDRLHWTGALDSAERVRIAVAECAYALAAVDRGLRDIAAMLPERCHVVAHEAITPAGAPVFAEMFRFLGLRGSPELLRAILAVVGSRVGGSDPSAGRGLLTRASVERWLAADLAAAQAEIARYGLDAARLHRLAGPGGHGFIVGDHHVHDSPHSTMF